MHLQDVLLSPSQAGCGGRRKTSCSYRASLSGPGSPFKPCTAYEVSLEVVEAAEAENDESSSFYCMEPERRRLRYTTRQTS